MASIVQKIPLEGSDHVKSFGISSSSVDIIPSPASSLQSINKSASNSLILEPLVSYDWEYKYYLSKLVTSHPVSGNFAWFIKGAESKALVRITHGETRTRTLLKDFDGGFLTLEFSTYSLPLLAVLSLDGFLKIYRVNHVESVNSVIFSINLKGSIQNINNFCLKWAPRAVNPEEAKDTALVLAVALNGNAYVIDLNGVVELVLLNPCPSACDIDAAALQYQSRPRLLKKMVTELPCQERYIDAMDFSSDASIFLTGSQDGKISLFNLSDFQEESLQPYHEFFPHGPSELTASHVVDFKTTSAPSGYVISGTHFNSELCLWRLHDYSLVQSIRFRPTDDPQKAQPSLLITCFDRTNNLLFASDIKRTVLYVLHLAQNPKQPDEVMFRCVSEFLLINPCIAFDVSRVSRTLSLGLPIAECAALLTDNIEVVLATIHPGELQIGKLRFSVPMSTYLNNVDASQAEPVGCGDEAVNTKESSVIGGSASTPTVEATPFYTDPNNLKSDTGSSPVLPGDDAVPVAEKEVEFSSNAPPLPPPCCPLSEVSEVAPETLEISTTLPNLENPLSPESITLQDRSENEVDFAHPQPYSELSPSVCSDAVATAAPPPPPRSLLLMHKKVSDSVPNNMNEASRRSPSPNTSEVSLPTGNRGDQDNDDPFLGVCGRAGELSDSVRSLAGSTSPSSLAPSNYDGRALQKSKDPRFAGDVPDPRHSSRPNLASSTSASNLGRFDPFNGGGPKGDVSRLLLPPMFSIPSTMAATGESNPKVEDVIDALEALQADFKSLAKSLTVLMNKTHENKIQLNRLVDTQNAIVNQVNFLVESTVSSPAGHSQTTAAAAAAAASATSVPPSPWIRQLTEQFRGQKTEIMKRLTQLENSVNAIKTPGSSTSTTGTPSAAKGDTVLDSKQLKAFQDQIRGVLRTELQNVFRTNSAKIVDPLRQCVTRTLEELMQPLPKLVADQIVQVIKDPKFLQYLAGTMGAVITPSLSNAYREELERVLAPAFSDSIDKLVRDIDALLRSGLSRHMQMVTSKVDSGVQSSRDKMDTVTRKLDEAVEKVSKEFTVTLTTKVNEAMNRLQLNPQPRAPPTLATVTPKEAPGKGPKGTTKHQAAAAAPAVASSTAFTSKLQPLSPDALEPYRIAAEYIQKNQYAKALETALTSTNQTVLLMVLQDLPVVQLFQQGVGQDLLLSLIHQLACGNLHDQLELKISFLQEAVNHLRANDSTVIEFGGNILSMLVSKISTLRASLQLSPAEENRAAALLRSVLDVQISLPLKS